MPLIHCPECRHEVSDTAATCPNCGYDLSKKSKDFVKTVKPLSEAKRAGYGGAIAGVVGSIIMIAVGIPLVAIGVGVIMIIVGIIGFFASLLGAKKYQFGQCPYCNTELRVPVGGKSFKCPVCNNVGAQTDTTLESTH